MVAEKHDLFVEYCNMDLIQEKLGIYLFVGKNIYPQTMEICFLWRDGQKWKIFDRTVFL
jgi:hypothetical protein